MPDNFPAPKHGFALAHFLALSNQDRSREFDRSLFGGEVVLGARYAKRVLSERL